MRRLGLESAQLAESVSTDGAASRKIGAVGDRKQLVDRLAHLSTIVPVLAKELVSARRLLSAFRAENIWLIEELSGLEASSARGNASALNGPESDRSVRGADTEVHGGGDRIRHLHHPVGAAPPPSEDPATTIVELTADQSARIETLSEDCTIVGVEKGFPLVRQAGGEIALLEGDGRLAPV